MLSAGLDRGVDEGGFEGDGIGELFVLDLCELAAGFEGGRAAGAVAAGAPIRAKGAVGSFGALSRREIAPRAFPALSPVVSIIPVIPEVSLLVPVFLVGPVVSPIAAFSVVPVVSVVATLEPIGTVLPGAAAGPLVGFLFFPFILFIEFIVTAKLSGI